jgi:hypothetical protein
MVHEKFHCNTSYVQIIWAICLVAWSGNNWSLCLCLWFPSLAFYLTCWIINPTSVWVLTAVGAQVRVSSHYCGCHRIVLLGWCDFITIKAQCLLTSFRQTTQVKFYCCQHGQLFSCMLGKTLWLAVNNLYRRYWADKAISSFRYCCLTAIKHCTTRSVLFPNNVWLQKNFCAEQRKIYLLHAVCLQGPLQICCCSCSQHCRKKIQSSSDWAFWGVLRSLRLAQDFGNVLASGCCAGNFSGMATCPSKWSTLRRGLKECVSSFPFSF